MDQYISTLYTFQPAFYTFETNLWTSAERHPSSVVVMDDEVIMMACKYFINLLVSWSVISDYTSL